MSDEPKALTHPELVIGIAGAIGIDIDAIAEEIDRALDDVGYRTKTVRVTDEMMKYPASGVSSRGGDHFNTMMYKMDYANKLCEEANDPARLMRIVVQAIGLVREAELASTSADSDGEGRVLPATAFIIRQLKRPAEVALMRRI